jgi:ATP-dependent Clp protease adaptor protein ClpS
MSTIATYNLNGTKEELDEDISVLEEITDETKVILLNDDVNTFDWVIECLVEVCEHDYIQAEQCAMLVHYKGKATVNTGEKEKLIAICLNTLLRKPTQMIY